MKRKLLCIFFMLAGAALITGTILFSLERYRNAELSPVVTLIVLSVVMIAAAAWSFNRESDAPEISGRERVFLWVFRAIGIISILVCFAFVIMMFFLTRYYTGWITDWIPGVPFFFMVLAVAGVFAAVLSLKIRPPLMAHGIARAVVALVIAAALGFVYINYIPKYSLDDGINILRSEKEFTQKDVFYPTSPLQGDLPAFRIRGTDVESVNLFGGNPFYRVLFGYQCDSFGYDADGLNITRGFILFNPATGAYEYTRKQEWDRTYKPEEWPKFNWSFMCDEDGQHGAVLNEYFREWPFPDAPAAVTNPIFSVRSGEWDLKLKDVMYPHNFPEDEARALLRSVGEEALKTKLLEQIELTHSYKDKTIDVFFFGIDIATYQNGQITLKL